MLDFVELNVEISNIVYIFIFFVFYLFLEQIVSIKMSDGYGSIFFGVLIQLVFFYVFIVEDRVVEFQ